MNFAPCVGSCALARASSQPKHSYASPPSSPPSRERLLPSTKAARASAWMGGGSSYQVRSPSRALDVPPLRQTAHSLVPASPTSRRATHPARSARRAMPVRRPVSQTPQRPTRRASAGASTSKPPSPTPEGPSWVCMRLLLGCEPISDRAQPSSCSLSRPRMVRSAPSMHAHTSTLARRLYPLPRLPEPPRQRRAPRPPRPRHLVDLSVLPVTFGRPCPPSVTGVRAGDTPHESAS
jgi:hypothetical protein